MMIRSVDQWLEGVFIFCGACYTIVFRYFLVVGVEEVFLPVSHPAFNVSVDFHGVFFPHCWRWFRRRLRSRWQCGKCMWHCLCHYEGCQEHSSALHTLNP